MGGVVQPLVKIVKIGQNCEIWPKLLLLGWETTFGQSCEIWSKLCKIALDAVGVEIVMFGQNCEIL